MAETIVGTRLTEAHRIGQINISKKVAAQLAVLFPLLDLKDLDATQTTWLNMAVEAIMSGRKESDALAAGYLTAFYQVEVGLAAPIVHDVITELEIQSFRKSMETLGPITIKAMMTKGYSLDYAGPSALSQLQRSASRHVQDGGRNTVQYTVENDDVATGWRRIGKGENCKFCNMLIGRGEVYNARTVKFASHDNCNCSVEPAFGGTPANVMQFEASKRNNSPESKQKLKDYLNNEGIAGYDKAKNPKAFEAAPKEVNDVDHGKSKAELTSLRDKLQASYDKYPSPGTKARIDSLNAKI